MAVSFTNRESLMFAEDTAGLFGDSMDIDGAIQRQCAGKMFAALILNNDSLGYMTSFHGDP